MPEPEIDSLRARWEADRTPVLTLQLADEYKARDEPAEALAVLRQGVEAHPEHVATRVAKGRHHLDLGEAAEAAADLERVARADPAHLLANKLLVDAYTRLGDLARARDRLGLYALLSSGDPELAQMERRIEAAAEPRTPEPREEVVVAETVAPETGPAGGEPFDLAAPPAPVQAPSQAPDLAPAPAPVRSPIQTSAPAGRAPKIEVAEGEPFGEAVWPGLDDSRYRAALFEDGLFATTAAAPAVEPARPEAAEPTPTDAAEASAQAAAELAAQTPADRAAEAQDLAATLTLAELYRKQGHESEAAAMFREVLERQPGNSRAARALREIDKGQSWPLSAADLLAGGDVSLPDGSRRGELLRRYRERLRPKR